MINPLDLRPDLAEALSTYDSKTDHGLLMITTTAFMPKNEFNVEAQLAFIMTMTLAVLPTIECYDKEWRSNTKDLLKRVKYYWKSNQFFTPQLPIKDVVSKSEHQALDEAYLVLHHCCQKILRGRATVGCFESIIDDVTEGYAILPGHESIQEIRDWMFDEVIPYCAAGALPPFIYTIDGIKPTAAALKRLLNHG